MTHKAAHEYALPPEGQISRVEAWKIVLEREGLVKRLLQSFCVERTGGGSRLYAGNNKDQLFDELLGPAYEAALSAAESWNESKTRGGAFATFMGHRINSRLIRAAGNLEKERGGPGAESVDALPQKKEKRTVALEDAFEVAWELSLPSEPQVRRVPEILLEAKAGVWRNAGQWLEAREEYDYQTLSKTAQFVVDNQLASHGFD